MRVLGLVTCLPGLVVFAGCSSGESSAADAGGDGGCEIEVDVGTGDRDTFVALQDGDPVEVILGFQGFRMLELAVRLRGASATTADLTAHLEMTGSEVEVDQVDRQMPVSSLGEETGVVESYLIFFNDAPASQIVGHEASFELIVRSAGCTGTDQVTIQLRDDEDCVDTEVVVPDASVPDGGLQDGAVPCDGGV